MTGKVRFDWVEDAPEEPAEGSLGTSTAAGRSVGGSSHSGTIVFMAVTGESDVRCLCVVRAEVCDVSDDEVDERDMSAGGERPRVSSDAGSCCEVASVVSELSGYVGSGTRIGEGGTMTAAGGVMCARRFASSNCRYSDSFLRQAPAKMIHPVSPMFQVIRSKLNKADLGRPRLGSCCSTGVVPGAPSPPAAKR